MSERFSIEVLPAAQKQLEKLDRVTRVRIIRRIEALSKDPRGPSTKPLTGHPLWRLRVGDHRVVYRIYDHKLVVVVVQVAHRRDVYRDL